MDGTTQFGILDYTVFCILLFITLMIGVYTSYKGNKSTEQYLMGDRAFRPITVSASLLTSFVSAISLLGYSGEAYGNGLQMLLFVFGASAGIIFSAYFIIPVIHPLQLTSVNEYLERRFKSPHLQRCISMIAVLTMLLYMGVCLYAPSIPLASLTKWSKLNYIILLGILCTVYSSIGGIRAVLFTDVFQFWFMMTGLIVTTIAGCIVSGGFLHVWNAALESGRLNVLNMNPSVYERHNFYNTLSFGFFFYSLTYGITQINFQRLCSVKTLQESRKILYQNIVGLIVIYVLIFFSGLVAYAAYEGCDPLTRGSITVKEEILTFYINDKLSFIPGLPGIFVATLTGGSLSSLSSTINALVALVWKDFLQNYSTFKNMSTNAALLVNILMAIILGTLIIGLAIMALYGGSLVHLTITILGVTCGPMYGVFLIALFLPQCNVRSVWIGFVISLVFVTWISVGGFYHQSLPPTLLLSTENCSGNFSIAQLAIVNATKSVPYDVEQISDTTDEVSPLDYVYKISYTLYVIIGTLLCIFTSVIISAITGNQNIDDVDPKLITPLLRHYYWPNLDRPTKRTDKIPITEIKINNLSTKEESCKKHDFIKAA